MPSATIKLFLPHGDPKRLRTAEISNWSGKAVAAPRTDFDALLDRKEMGQRTPTGFVVFKGSHAVLTPRPTASQYVSFVVATREAFTKDGTLVPEGDRLVFTRDVEFSSLSAAAAIVHGGSANGLIAWRDKAGRTLKEIEGE